MEITEGLIDRWLDEELNRVENIYENTDHKRPPIYTSNKDALDAIKQEKDNQLKIKKLNGERSKKLGAGDAASIIIRTVAITFIESPASSHALAVYDYDKKIYTFNTMTVLNDYIVAIMGVSSQSIINSVVTTLTGLREFSAVYNPLPKHKIAVGNGIFNCLTNQLEEFTPYYTVLTKIATNYKDHPIRPQYPDGFTLESMIASLANNDPDRIKLISQICKAIFTEHSLKPGLFIILGSGGDGKSTFFTMIANIIGEDNVAYVNFSELESPDKMAETINKKMVLGLDNDVKVYLRKTALLKSIASHETITYSRKYMSAISVPFTGTFVQLCNEMPRMAESGASMKRRLVSFKAENSHYESGTENDNVDTVYIKDRKFKEYALWYFLNEEKTPYYKDFNDVDRAIVNDSLDAEDVLSQYLAEIYQLDVINDRNEYLPSSHLYAAYQDWMEINNPGSKMLSARGFSIQVTPKLKDYGYEPTNQSNIRPGSLERSNVYDPSYWDEYRERPHLDKAIALNTPSKTFIKTGEKKSQSEIRRKSYEISPFEYFNIAARINAVLSQEEINQYQHQVDDNDEVLDQVEVDDSEVEQQEPSYDIDQLAEEKQDNKELHDDQQEKDQQEDNNNEEKEENQQEDNNHEEENQYDEEKEENQDDKEEIDIYPPFRLDDVIEKGDLSLLDEYDEYLNRIEHGVENNFISSDQYVNVTDVLAKEVRQMRRLAFRYGDSFVISKSNEDGVDDDHEELIDLMRMFVKLGYEMRQGIDDLK